MSVRWDELRIAVVAGDEREREIARLAAKSGATVAAYGFPWPEGGIDGVTLAANAAQALEGARYALFPIPGITPDGALFAPAAPTPIVPDAELLSGMADGAWIVLGMADDGLRSAAAANGIGLSEYEDDRQLMLERGPAIVEGALRAAVEHTDVTIHAAQVAVVGHGTIGGLLARTLRAVGARVTVVARNPVQRAEARANGLGAVPLEELPRLAGTLQMVFSTVPAPVVDAGVLRALTPGSLVMDLSAPPGGVDLATARELGHRAVWARGLGRRAPVTVGTSQWGGVRRRIEEIEARGARRAS
jgi:dipicolinate synthase subunit A